VPEQLSVVGFDDLEMSRHWQPALTTMHVPTEAMWTLAAEYLLARLDGPGARAAAAGDRGRAGGARVDRAAAAFGATALSAKRRPQCCCT
jgi:hypothetical protein